MKTARPDLIFLGIVLIVFIVLAGMIWFNLQLGMQYTGGQAFLPRWLGTRFVLNEGANPYSVATSNAMQAEIYGGRAARPGEDKLYFLYPYYAIPIFMPFALAKDYSLASALWMTALQAALVGTVFASLAVTRWRASGGMMFFYVLVGLFWYHAVKAVLHGDPVVLVALFLSLGFALIIAERDTPAGILLAVSAIKPQVVVLLLPLVVIWGLSRRRHTLVKSLLISLAVLLIGSLLAAPGWLLGNAQQILRALQISGPATPGAIFTSWGLRNGEGLGQIVALLSGGLLLREWWLAYGQDGRWFLWTAMLTLLLTNLIGIPTNPDNFVVLFPALALVFSIWEQRWGRGGRGLVIFVMVGLAAGLWWLGLRTRWAGELEMFFAFPLILLLLLYWVRYWALRSRPLPIEQLKVLKRL